MSEGPIDPEIAAGEGQEVKGGGWKRRTQSEGGRRWETGEGGR